MQKDGDNMLTILLNILLALYIVVIMWLVSIDVVGGLILGAASVAIIGGLIILFVIIKKEKDKSDRFNRRK